MLTPTPNQEQSTETPSATSDLGNLSFAEYEKARRGEALPEKQAKPSAPEAKASEQKESSESETEEKEAKESEAEDESESDEGDEESKESEKEKPKKKGGFQRRIDKLNTAKAAAQQEAEYWKRKALEGAGEPAQGDKVEPKSSKDGEPNPDDFDTVTEYTKAVVKWDREQAEKASKEEANRKKLAEQQDSLLKSHFDRVNAFKEKAKDYDDVLAEAEDVQFSPSVTQAILESEVGPEIIYELAKDPEEAKRIAGLEPVAAAKAIGKLESKLEAKASAESKPEPKKVTKAPKPIEPVSGGKSSIVRSIYDKDLPFEQYEQVRREEMKRKRG